MVQRQFLFAFSRSAFRVRASRARRGAFTLVEIMVALAIFAVMMAIIFVPLNLGLNLFSIGQSRSTVLQAAHTTLDDMERELQKAIMVFPNEALAGVTDKAPYTSSGVNPSGKPYLHVKLPDITTNYGVCNANDVTRAEYVNNPHRLDFLLPDTFSQVDNSETGQAAMPLKAAPYLVSYYYRRQSVNLAADPFDNPIILFRAQMPYREFNGTVIRISPPPSGFTNPRNINLLPVAQSGESSRYPNPTDTTACGASEINDTNRGSAWLEQTTLSTTYHYNEPDMAFFTKDNPQLPAAPAPTPYPEVTRAHTAMLPKGVALVTRNAFGATPDYTPDTTFRCADTNSDGKIDQVTITLVVGSFDEGAADRSNSRASDRKGDISNNQGVNSQRIRLTRVVRLANVR
jgi:prepilin-type N-terminal cleavage/methylation domain-containing protein